MRLLQRVKAFAAQLAELVYVPKCASCFSVLPSKEIPLCENCRKVFLLESKRLCPSCGRAHRFCICRIKFEQYDFAYVHITSYDMRRDSVSRNMILHLKDDRFDGAFDFFAEQMLTALKERYIRLFERGNIVISYVPRSQKAKRRAGHDQSEQIAVRLSSLSGAPCVPLFVNNSRSSQKKLNRSMREVNAKESYALAHPELKLGGRVIVIVDDVVTTGSSIGACGALAKKNGAKAVIGLVCAKTINAKGLNEDTFADYLNK